MAVAPSENSHLTQLNGYINFLLHDHLQEATVENLNLARENKLPLLGLLSHFTEQALYAYFKNSLERLLVSLLEGKVLEVTYETMQKWRKDELEELPRTKVQVADVVLAYSIRKQVFIKFLGAFTQDTQQAISIALAIEKLFVKIENLALHTYVEIQEEELKTLNHNLTEHQEELQAINEELRESQEELQATNDELKEQVEIRQTAEEALEKERNYLEAILENISNGIVACDERGVLSFFNKATRNFHGIGERALPPEEWGAYYSLYQADEKTPLSKEEIPLFKAYRGEWVDNVEMVIAPVQGQKRTLLASGRQIISSQGKSLGAVVVMHDITERKKAQKEQEEANRSLHELNQELATALEELQSTEEQLVEANNELELRVQARTDELAASEEELRQTLDKTVELNEVILENRSLLHTVANAAPVALWMSGTREEFTYVNQTWIDWTGRPFEAHMGEGWALAIIPEDGARVIKKYQSAFRARKFYQVDFRIQHQDGDIHWCVASGVPRILANGDFAGYVGSCIDITERKLAEQALKESEERARFLLEAMPQKVWTADAEGSADYFNQHWMNYTGRSFEGLKAWGWSDIIHPEDLGENIRLWKHSIETGTHFEFEHRFRTKEGSYRWHLSRGIPMKDEQGKVVMWVGTNTDVHEQKKTEEEQQRLVSIVERSPDFIGYASPEGHVLYINKAGQEMTGLESMEDAQSRKISDFFFPEEEAYSNKCIMPEVVEKGRWEGEFRFKNFKTGEPVPVNYNIFQIQDKISGEIKAFATVTRNIGERKKREEELKNKNQELERINNDLDNFIYTASHDLKAPITNIEGLVHLLVRHLPAESLEIPVIDKVISMMGTSVERFKNTINDLTELTKLQKSMEDDISLIHLPELFEEIRLDLETVIQSSGAKFAVDFKRCPAIHFSKKNLRSILYNLVSNAIKYHSPEREPLIRISSKLE